MDVFPKMRFRERPADKAFSKASHSGRKHSDKELFFNTI